MDANQYITQGMIIESEGIQYECTLDLGGKYEFQALASGIKRDFELTELLIGFATQEICRIPAKVTPRSIDTDSGPQSEKSSSCLSEKNLRALDNRMEFVQGILKRGITRGQRKFLEEAAQEIAAEINCRRRKDEEEIKPPSAPTLNRWIARYEKNSRDIMAVLSKTVFRPKPQITDAKNEELIQEALEQELLEEGNGRISDIHKEYLNRLSAYNHEQILLGREPLPEVSYSSIARRFYAIPSFDRDAAIHGIQVAKVNHRVAKGHLPSNFALQFVEVDHGQLDLYVIDDLLFVPLGIPWITILRDRHTGIVLGFYISFRQTSLQSIFGAIRHSIMPHTRIAELWPDIKSPWPWGFALCYVSDRGGDFLSPRYRLALREMGSDAQYCETRTPWHKGGIERYIGATNRELIETLPGKTFPFRRAPPGYDARKQAVVRFSTLVYLLHKWIAEVYHHKPHSRKLACPLERWDQSLNEMPVPIPPSPEKLIVLTGEMHERTVSQEGILHQWLNYSSPQLNEICDDLGRVKIPFVSNLENLGWGMAIDPRTQEHFRVNCMSPDYANGLSMAQHQFIRRNTKIKLTRDNAVPEFMRVEREIQESLAEEILAKETADKLRLHKVAIRAGINSEAVLNGAARSVADIIKQGGVAVSKGVDPNTSESAIADMSCTDVPSFQCL